MELNGHTAAPLLTDKTQVRLTLVGFIVSVASADQVQVTITVQEVACVDRVDASQETRATIRFLMPWIDSKDKN